MNNLINSGQESFQIFLAERNIPDPDELLGKALKYLQDKGNSVSLKGVDSSNTPIVQIGDSLYKFDKCFGLWHSAKFTKITENSVDIKNDIRLEKIKKYYLQ